MYRCLMSSLSKTGIKDITVWKEDYFIANTPSANGLLKVIICESRLDTKSTVLHICSQLSSLHEYIELVMDDIVKFNTYVQSLIQSLNERGETTQDLLANVKKETHIM